MSNTEKIKCLVTPSTRKIGRGGQRNVAKKSMTFGALLLCVMAVEVDGKMLVLNCG